MVRPLDPLAFLDVAQEIVSLGQDEAKLRTAIGRAYYAAFLVARATVGITTRQDVHKSVIQALRKRPGFLATAQQLDALRRLRVVADYQLLPRDPADRDWVRNWGTCQVLVRNILRRLT